MLKIASIIAMAAVCVSSAALAVTIVDKNGKPIGESISNVRFSTPNEDTPQQATGDQREDNTEPARSMLRGIIPKGINGRLPTVVIAQHEDTFYALLVGHQTIGATHQLFFKNRDCTGTAGIPMLPEDSQERMISPSALGPDETFWIMTHDDMIEVVTKSFWNAVRGECESIESNKQSLTPVRAIGDLNTEYEAPFSVISDNGEQPH